MNRYAPVAQLDRALPSEGKGHTFESCRVRQEAVKSQKRPKLDLCRGSRLYRNRSKNWRPGRIRAPAVLEAGRLRSISTGHVMWTGRTSMNGSLSIAELDDR